MTEKPVPEPSRLERVLAFMSVGIVLLSVASMIITMIGGANHWPDSFVMRALVATALIGMPVAILLLLALVITGIVRRRRAR